MNYALIIAGGSGNRMGQDIPKQFMHVDLSYHHPYDDGFSEAS